VPGEYFQEKELAGCGVKKPVRKLCDISATWKIHFRVVKIKIFFVVRG
jgi:hypothetical protein